MGKSHKAKDHPNFIHDLQDGDDWKPIKKQSDAKSKIKEACDAAEAKREKAKLIGLKKKK